MFNPDLNVCFYPPAVLSGARTSTPLYELSITGSSPSDKAAAGDERSKLGSGAYDGDAEQERNSQQVCNTESMHIACKALFLLTKHRGNDVRRFMELLVRRLSEAAAFVPMVISFQCEQILCEVSCLDTIRFMKLILTYAGSTTGSSDRNAASVDRPSAALVLDGSNPHIRLTALHALAVCVKHTSSPLLLEQLTPVLDVILPSFGSGLVDTRKAVVFILVEMYAIVGETLYSYLKDLTPPQSKLLAIYIHRQLSAPSASRKLNSNAVM